MPITLPVPGGGGATLPSTYYNGSNLGEYQFISIKEIIANFQAAFVGEGKVLENVLSGDVRFHAYRALQELHYDTVRSCKSQEIEVCSSLKMPLPHDYINYVKLAFIDNNGIEHVLYPASKTSNPFAIQQKADCSYEFEEGDLMHQKTCSSIISVSCSAADIPDLQQLLMGNAYLWDANNEDYLGEKASKSLIESWKTKVDDYCNCAGVTVGALEQHPCGEFTSWGTFDALFGGLVAPSTTFSVRSLEMLERWAFLIKTNSVPYPNEVRANGGNMRLEDIITTIEKLKQIAVMGTVDEDYYALFNKVSNWIYNFIIENYAGSSKW